MAGSVEPRGQYSPGDPAHLRVSDEDRHKVAEILREAAGEGRIDLDELDERLGAAYAAKTYADLVPITVDLPIAGVPPPRDAESWRRRSAGAAAARGRRARRALQHHHRRDGRLHPQGPVGG